MVTVDLFVSWTIGTVGLEARSSCIERWLLYASDPSPSGVSLQPRQIPEKIINMASNDFLTKNLLFFLRII